MDHPMEPKSSPKITGEIVCNAFVRRTPIRSSNLSVLLTPQLSLEERLNLFYHNLLQSQHCASGLLTKANANRTCFKKFSHILELSKPDNFELKTLFLKGFLWPAMKKSCDLCIHTFPDWVPEEQIHGSLICPWGYISYHKDDCNTCLCSTISSPWLDLSNTILTSNSSLFVSINPYDANCELPAVLNVRM